jgi:2-oxoglutarate dehydrogenase E1 component
VAELYAKRLIDEGTISEADYDAMKGEFRKRLEEDFDASDNYKPNKADWLDGRWSGLKATKDDDDPRRGKTGVNVDRLRRWVKQITAMPDGFNIHRTLKRVMDARAKAISAGENLDWATAESLAFASLLDEGSRVRLSGQDVERGTFSQRHAVWVDQETEKRYAPLKHVSGKKTYDFECINSMLSEEAVLGFEYGYSLAEPQTLVLWEAQFGDFANGAQVVFDQFLSSGERKWLRMSGLVCMLPHGYEGQGPEHSSARLERLPADVCGRQHAGSQLHDAGQLLPHPAPPDAP